MNNHQITLKCDNTSLLAAVKSLEQFFEGPIEVRERILCGLKGCREIVRIECDNSAVVTTGEVLVVFHPSDCFLELMAATRAGAD